MSHSDDGTLFATATCQAVIKAGEIAIPYPNGCPGNFDQDGTEPGITVAGFPALVLSGALIIARAHLGPRSQVVGIGEPRGYIRPDFDEDFFCCTLAYAMDRVDLFQNVLVRLQAFGNILIQFSNLLVKEIEVIHLAFEQPTLVRAHLPLQRILKVLHFFAQLAFGHRRQFFWVLYTVNHGLEYHSAGYSHYIAGNAAEFNISPLQDLLYPAYYPTLLSDKGAAIAYYLFKLPMRPVGT